MIETIEINERKFFYIDVGNMSKEKCQELINEVVIAMNDISPSEITVDNKNQ